ncbi:MAG: YdeI/OmpD-associated family protein [Candidatus Izemoplasmatales bacterium]
MNPLQFLNRQECHEFFLKHHEQSEGIWIQFDKENIPGKLTSDEALSIALCFGWIDGTIQRIDDRYYCKYFTPRRPKSLWSEKNKHLAESLFQAGLMQESGIKEMEKAKKEGRWNHRQNLPEDFSLDAFDRLIQPLPQAFEQYQKMSPSVRKTYAKSYYALKSQASREKRLLVIIQRLEQGLKPM